MPPRCLRFTPPPLQFQEILLFMPVLLFSVIAHEYAHGYAALKQGDDTALSLGRLTWNPIKHIDPFMTVILPAMLFVISGGKVMLGGAKPVPVDPRKYRELRKGDIIVSLAGVLTNLLISIGCVVLVALFGFVGRFVPALDSSMGILQAMMILGVQLNLILIAFNLIPIPPLDGSHVFKYLMPASWAYRYVRVGQIGMIALIALMYFAPSTLEVWLGPAFKVSNVMVNTVDGTVLPSTAHWLHQ